jgi:hypothetical protein
VKDTCALLQSDLQRTHQDINILFQQTGGGDDTYLDLFTLSAELMRVVSSLCAGGKGSVNSSGGGGGSANI